MKFRVSEKRKNSTVTFEGILPDIIHEFQLEKSFTIEDLVTKWHTIVGDIISTHSKPDRIFKKILFIAADHSMYANEIMIAKDRILKVIHEEFPFQAIRDIKVEIKNIRW
jgi:predicted nucleic acid-binding Zn ribbon protein